MVNDLPEGYAGSDIAVVGMAGRFPGAGNTSEYWDNLRRGVESVTLFSDEELKAAGVDQATLRNANYIKSGAPLPDMESFDAAFFGFSPRDAAIMDPQHRQFLETAWEALETAGHTPVSFAGSIGVFAGSGMHAYLMYNLLTNPDLIKSVGMFLIRHTGNDKDFLTTRVSYLLDLKGPSINVQTACSTSLVAIHMAAQSLLSGECDMALAGGVTIEVPHRRGYEYQEGEILSPDGHCRAFDARSKGTIFGSGVGVVVLRRLADALADGDSIRAVIKGSAVNNDGSLKAGYLAPSVEGQAKAVAEALAIADVDAESITYVEAHGTGTPVGDPIEVAALTQAFGTQTEKTGFCGIGSVKTNIGHLDTAAGVASFIKVALALEHGELPPSLHFEQPNPAIDFEQSPFYVNNRLAEWNPRGFPRRAAVNSLGVGGTNAFVILEQAPAVEPSATSRPFELLVLSAKTESALDAATTNLARHLRRHPDLNLANVAYTLQVGRKPFAHRRVVAGRDAADAASALEQRDARRVFSHARGQADPSIVFMFPGGGAQYPNMGRDLYETEPVYREQVDTCLRLLEPHVRGDLKRLMFPADGDLEAAARELEKPSAGLPALFIAEYALAQLWMSWGIQPAAMTGHSMGEYTAACLAGVMSLEDALALVALRGVLFETLPEGAMLSVRCPEEELRPLLDADLDLAAINGPGLCLASGPIEAIARLEDVLTERGVEHSRLKISVAAHSRMLEPILEEFGKRVATFQLLPPTLPFISNLTGTWATADEVTDPRYWVRHLRLAVRFSDGITTLLKEPNRVLLEVGPGQGLSSLAKQHLTGKAAAQSVVASTRHPRETVSDVQCILTALGRLWLAGAAPDWAAVHANERRRRVPLPTYPFERQRHWIEPGKPVAAVHESKNPLAKLSSLDDWFYRPTWKPAAPVAADGAGQPLRWLVFRDRLGLGDRLIGRLERGGHRVISVSAGEAFARLGEAAYIVNPDERTDYDALVAELAAHGALPQRIVHLWSVAAGNPPRGGLEGFEASQALGFYSLLSLAQALGGEDLAEPLHIDVVTNQLHSVEGEPILRPERATLLGPCKVIPREFPGITCRSVDVMLPEDVADVRADAGALADELVAELSAPAGEQVVALRRGARWIESFEAARVDEPAPGASRLREGGVYLITGGLGGIGLVQAEYLARTARAKLVLVGRSGLPPREEWGRWLETHAEGDAASRRIRKVRELEALGAEVLVAAADVADLEQMRAVVQDARDRFGAIHGVIHAAGVLNDGVIQLKTREAAAGVLAPKVKGALVLDALLGERAPDFVVLFSSTSAILGPAGQVDYVGANAFLNTFAHSKASRGGPYTVALDWGVWQEVGMAAAAANRAGRSELRQPPTGEPAGHPLLGVRTADTADEVVYRARYSTAEHWILDQHRIKGGEAVVPGTGYLEIARAAATRGTGHEPVELTDVYFMSPLRVRDGEQKDVRISLRRDGAAYAFSIESDVASPEEAAPDWQEHARATIVPADAGEPVARQLDEIRARCTLREVVFGAGGQRTKQEDYVAFGPRWKVVRRIDFGADEALAELELPAEFARDLAEYRAHPALVDLAAHVGLPLIEGYDRTDDFYVPFSCKRVRIREALEGTLYSHVRYNSRQAGGDLAAFDVVIMDARGRVLAEIEDFTCKRVGATAVALTGQDRGAGDAGGRASQTAARPQTGLPNLLQLGLTEGILPSEGAAVLARVLAAEVGPQVVATSVDLHALIAQQQARPVGAAAAPKTSAGVAADSYVAPRNDVERKLAAFWQELLGLQRVGVHDDFFELGGYSLIAVRLFAKIKKAFGVELSLDLLFRAPTIATCAEILAEELGMELTMTVPSEPMASTNGMATAATNGTAREVGPANGAVPGAANGTVYRSANGTAPARRSARWSPLVPIQTNGSKLPFFCVHGAGGNVLIFRDLSRRLGSDQPFYGLQAQGVDGKLPPLQTIEDMASQYLEAIRQVQPNGPYLLGGYSGGGVVAFEMAQQLLAAGEETALLAFLDTFNPGPAIRRDTNRGRFRKLVERGPAYALDRARWLWDVHVRDGVKQARVDYYTSRGLTVPYELREFQIYQTFHRVQAQYRPRAYPGSIVLFRAAQIAGAFAHVGPELGWMGLAEQGIKVLEIPGTHDTLVLEPNVEILVTHLKASLEAAQTRVAETGLVASGRRSA